MDFFGYEISVSFLLLLLIPILTYFFLTWDHGFWQKQGIPGPRPVPLFGTNLETMISGFFISDRNKTKKYGKVVGLYGGRKPELLLADIDIIKQVMIKKFDNFINRGALGRAFSEHQYGIGKMLTVLIDEEWKNVRNTLTPAFSANKLKVMIKHINECAETLVSIIDEKTREGKDVVVKNVTDLYTFDVIGRVGFGVDMNSQKDPDSPFIKYGRKIFNFSFFKPGIFIPFLFPGLFKSFRKSFPNTLPAFDQESQSFFLKLAKQVIDERTQSATQPGKNDLIQLMLNAHTDEIKKEDIDTEIGGDIDQAPPKRGLTYEEILGQCFILMAAGFDTTSTTLSFLLYNLAVSPKCQDKLYQEINKLETDSTTVTYEMSHSCAYLEMCIMESLRMFPPIARVDRECKSDTIVDGISISKGMTVVISVGSLHYDPDIWPEPDTFKPERFTPEARAARDPFHYLPFGMGPRNCIGMRIAQMELRVALIKILQKFKVMTCEKTDIPPKLDQPGLLRPRNPIVLRFEPRNGLN